jgi:peptidoglycan hydrolase-like protein with peptidoglycan-binding domain
MLTLEIVGHADPQGTKDKNITISKNRAECTALWLVHDVEAFRKRFDGDGPCRPWGWEEVQWMLLAVPIGGAPTYLSQVDGCAGPETHLALALFQSTRGLPANGLADDTTLERLITEYLALVGTAIGPEQVFACGAGPDHPPVTFGNNQDPVTGDGSVQQLRRVDFFIKDGRMSPPASQLAELTDGYENWCKQVKVDLSLPDVFNTQVAVVDERTLPLVEKVVTITEPMEDGSEGPGVGEGVPDVNGAFVVQLPRGVYGVYALVKDEVLRGTLAIDPDLYGAQRIALIREPEPVDLRDVAKEDN